MFDVFFKSFLFLKIICGLLPSFHSVFILRQYALTRFSLPTNIWSLRRMPPSELLTSSTDYSGPVCFLPSFFKSLFLRCLNRSTSSWETHFTLLFCLILFIYKTFSFWRYTTLSKSHWLCLFFFTDKLPLPSFVNVCCRGFLIFLFIRSLFDRLFLSLYCRLFLFFIRFYWMSNLLKNFSFYSVSSFSSLFPSISYPSFFLLDSSPSSLSSFLIFF